eukprot:gb/GECH01010940.1/.p1 GENE.gb/GECH01010940.1/~~gb/GECH01010940.1/.p1  ORF type:complete len:163 (+),score=17.05 gb/GECH01010940.1/:1-489(+)
MEQLHASEITKTDKKQIIHNNHLFNFKEKHKNGNFVYLCNKYKLNRCLCKIKYRYADGSWFKEGEHKHPNTEPNHKLLDLERQQEALLYMRNHPNVSNLAKIQAELNRNTDPGNAREFITIYHLQTLSKKLYSKQIEDLEDLVNRGEFSLTSNNQSMAKELC